MLHTKFQDHGAFISGEEYCLQLFTKYGCGGYLSHVNKTISVNLCPLFPTRLHIKFSFDWPSDFRGETVLKTVVIYSPGTGAK